MYPQVADRDSTAAKNISQPHETQNERAHSNENVGGSKQKNVLSLASAPAFPYICMKISD